MRFLLLLIYIALSGYSYSQGLIFDEESYENAPIKPHLTRGSGFNELPPVASLKQFCPRPGNQLRYQTAVGWAIAWAGRTILYAQHNNLKSPEKEQNVFSPAYIYQKANEKDEVCLQGITLEEGLKVLKKSGVPKLRDFMYFCQGPLDEQLEEEAQQYKISDYARLYNRYNKPEDKVEAIKKSLSEGYPVVAGMYLTKSFQRASEFWQPTDLPEDKINGHAICIVGYDDTKYGGAFEIVNSWGKSWGNDGFMWIRYKDVAEYLPEAYELFELPSQSKNLEGSIDLVLTRGGEMDVEMLDYGYYKTKRAYGSADEFQIFINNNEPAFLYVIGSDLTNSYFQLFPYNDHVSAALNYKKSRIAIPDETQAIQFDDTPGTNYLLIIYAREELDVHAIMKQLEKANGTFNEKVHHVLDPRLLNKNAVWTQNKVRFKGVAENGSMVAAIVEIPQGQ